MKKKIKELILRYPGYVHVILGLSSDDINLLYDMSHEFAVELLEELSNDNEDNNKKQKVDHEPVLYYSNF